LDAVDAPTVSLVLGAGGARGLAHIGAIEVLQERGFRIVAVAGSSSGALIGGIFAAGKLAEYKAWALTLQRSSVLRLLDFTFGFPGLFKGERVIGVLREMVGERHIEELPVLFTAVATNLATEREVWINRGSLFDAIRASIAIPMLLTPQRIGDRDLVDGGLLAPIPIAATRQALADLVVAVDLNARGVHSLLAPPAAPAEPPEPLKLPAPGSLRARLGAWMGTSSSARPSVPPRVAVSQPGLIDLMSRSLDTMQGQLGRMQLAQDPPDLLIRIPREACEFYEFWRAAELIAIGREAAERALAHSQ
jgi:NTE family protein